MKISPLLWIPALALSLALVGCGKRPNSLDLPEDVPDDHFPHFYPNPALDPQPNALIAKQAPGIVGGSTLSGMNNMMGNGLILDGSVMSSPSNQGPMMSGGGGGSTSLPGQH